MAKVEVLTAQVQQILRDDGVNYSPEKIHGYLHEGEIILAVHKNSSTARDIDYQCAVGAKQDLSSVSGVNVAGLLSVKSNGTIENPKTAVRMVSRDDLDQIDPSWRSADSADEIDEYIHDAREPTIFYTNPPASAGQELNISVYLVPAPYGDVSDTTETTVSDLDAPSLVEWALYRAFSEDSEGTPNFQRSSRHLQGFSSLSGVKLQNEYRSSPKNPENRR
ncbi:MAG: DUF6682 family protein [Cellvibrionaceae bacterium]